MNIQEDYVSFETAKLLKEKGFDVYGDGSFNSGIEVFAEYSPSGTFNKCITSKPHQKAYPAPSLYVAMKWLREVHNIFISPRIQNNGTYICYLYDTNGNAIQGYDKTLVQATCEEACEAILKYCLENLI